MSAFRTGERVRMLIETSGPDDAGRKQTFPAGTLGEIMWIDGDAIHVGIGPDDIGIFNVFDDAYPFERLN